MGAACANPAQKLLAMRMPTAAVCVPSPRQPAEFVLAATVGSLGVVAIACVRIFLGWKYVGDRLFSATVAYEESGVSAAGQTGRAVPGCFVPVALHAAAWDCCRQLSPCSCPVACSLLACQKQL